MQKRWISTSLTSKVEQIKKLVNKGDYETAMKIADTIDWRRVRSTSLLTTIPRSMREMRSIRMPRIFCCWLLSELQLEKGFYLS